MTAAGQAPTRPALNLLDLAGAQSGAAAIEHPDGDPLCYGEARRLVASCPPLREVPGKALVAIAEPRSLSGLLGYLATLAAGHTALLIEDRSLELWDGVLAAYQPDLLLALPGALRRRAAALGFRQVSDAPVPAWANPASGGAPLHPDLALLMRTSGSLGTPKMVRLSFGNLASNAVAIAQAVGLRAGDCGVTSLPLDFSFGLSLVNSHLAAGASVAVSPYSASSQPFWQFLDHVGGTCLGAVPSTYRYLWSRGWSPAAHPSLRLLLHSGGPLDDAALAHFGKLMRACGGEFISMYGQTEATARLCCLPAALADTHRGSVGFPIPGGHVRVIRADGTPAADGETGEVIYRGPNVMMGYAAARADLAQGRTQGEDLHTGDLGFLRDGFLYLAGRMDRQVKVFGRRIDLAQIEKTLLARGIAAAAEAAGPDRLVVAADHLTADLTAACAAIATSLGLPRASVRAVQLGASLYNERGKVDHGAVRRALA